MENIKYLIGSEAYNLLLNESISSLQDILFTDINRLQDIAGISLDKVNEIIHIASEQILKNKIHVANEIEPWVRIGTGCGNIDEILLGGIPINGITELYGCSGVGKTQFCLQVALNIQLPNQLGGQTKEVIYISTEDIFPSKRLKQLANAYRNKYNLEISFEDHIYLEHINDSEAMQNCLSHRLPYFLTGKNVGLLVIDSIAGIFRSENDNPDYIFRSRQLKLLAKSLNNLQDQFHCGILIVNQVTDNLSTGITEPCLGLSWGNNVTCRFCLSRLGCDGIRKFEVIFAPDLPPRSCNIIITAEGLSNVK